MIPSERVRQIEEKLKEKYTGSELMFLYGTTDVKHIAILEYLDEVSVGEE